jgi:cellulose synthase/poly-beta-1,6-N-acetylglucosamine synthase-like glycosyltransferase
MKRKSNASWPTKVDYAYKPKVSIIIPTYNEAGVIGYKLDNSSRITYPEDLFEIVIVDSNSSDDTGKIVRDFSEKEKNLNITLLVEGERKGKSHALNNALAHCKGDIVIISDADCFWPSDILEKALPYLADPSVGVIGGPKIFLNSSQTWVTRMEENYLKSANILRLGESKAGSTVFFEGGFSAFKREAFDKFDPYSTGSDDCGTVVQVIERNYRAMLVKEAKFYSTFPSSFRCKLSVKLRRCNQLVRVFGKYLESLIEGKVKDAKVTVVPNIFLYLFSPIAFFVFVMLSVLLAYSFPYILIALVFLIISQVRFYTYEIFESNLILLVAIFGVLSGKSFSIWNQPEDRALVTKDVLGRFNLIKV